jgi:hypothetical protein
MPETFCLKFLPQLEQELVAMKLQFGLVTL